MKINDVNISRFICMSFEMNRTHVGSCKITLIESWKWWTFFIIINLFIIIINCAAREMSHALCVCGAYCVYITVELLFEKTWITKPNDRNTEEQRHEDGWNEMNNTLACDEAHFSVQDIWECAHCVRLCSIEVHQMNALPWLKWAFHNLLGVERIYHYRVCIWNKSLGRFFFRFIFFAVSVLLYATWIYCSMQF